MNFRYYFHKSTPFINVLSNTDSLHTVLPYVLTMHSDIVLHLHFGLTNALLPSVSQRIKVYIQFRLSGMSGVDV